MIPGYPTTVHPGDHESNILIFDLHDAGTGLGGYGTIQAATGYGDKFVRIVCDDIPQAIIYMPEGGPPKPFTYVYDPHRLSGHIVTAAPLGDWDNDLGIDVSIQQMYAELGAGNNIELDWDAVIETVEAYGDSGQLSAWSLTGLSRFGTGRVFNTRKTQEQIDITLVNVSGTRTLTLSLSGYKLCEGSRIGDGIITLIELNSSGLSGLSKVAYTADIAEGAAYVAARWAKSYTVTVTDALSNILTKTITDDGLANRISAMIGPLATGAGTYSITPISDTIKTGTASTGAFTIPGRPLPVTDLAYVSGHSGTAPAVPTTTIGWTASATPGATYNIYDSALNMPTDFDTVAGTHIAGAGTLTQLLPVIAIGTGFRHVVVASVIGGIEDGTRTEITLEYAAGYFVPARPNVPAFSLRQTNPVSAGRTLNVNYSYNSIAAAGVATQIRLDLQNEALVITIGTPVAIASGSGQVFGSLSATSAADGWFGYRVVALTAAGTESSNTEFRQPEWLSNVILPGPSNVVATVRT